MDDDHDDNEFEQSQMITITDHHGHNKYCLMWLLLYISAVVTKQFQISGKMSKKTWISQGLKFGIHQYPPNSLWAMGAREPWHTMAHSAPVWTRLLSFLQSFQQLSPVRDDGTQSGTKIVGNAGRPKHEPALNSHLSLHPQFNVCILGCHWPTLPEWTTNWGSLLTTINHY